MFAVTITEYEIDNDDYRFRVKLHRNTNSWTVVRWPVDENPIPPRMQALTTKGWVGVIPASNGGYKFRRFTQAADIAALIRS